ncbi:MAG: sensor domain-containing diguanylate cyclase [Gammaproteobacteria bacterium]|jgi:diguanylate cyclase (GGDEF)-like protein
MKPAPIPDNEKLRQTAVDELDLGSLWSEPSFDRIVRLVVNSLQVPIAAFSVISDQRQIFKAAHGLDSYSTARAVSFCGHTIMSEDVMVVPDATQDDRFHDNPLVTGAPGVRFYIGAPVRSPGGARVGALCAVDREPRSATGAQHDLMRDLARVLESEVLLRSMQVRDPLTGVYARSTFDSIADRGWRRARSLGVRSGVIMLSLDRYLSHVRASGRHGTDQVLQRVGRCIEESCAGTDTAVGRMHDDRFVLFMAHRDGSELRRTAEQIRVNVEKLGIVKDSPLTRPITASIGIATQDEAEAPDRSLMDLFDRAYAALTRAKANGGNRIAAVVP